MRNNYSIELPNLKLLPRKIDARTEIALLVRCADDVLEKRGVEFGSGMDSKIRWGMARAAVLSSPEVLAKFQSERKKLGVTI